MKAQSIPSQSVNRVMNDLRDYVSIARPDHWFKNVFMIIGVLLAYLYYPHLFDDFVGGRVILALISVCLIASSNYVLNEILDAPTDRRHPVKCQRPVAAGRVWLPLGYVEWIALGVVGAWLAYQINVPFFLTSLSLWIMGLVYNVPPVRSKELPYLDVVSESVNNPIRLLLGWFVVTPDSIAPLSLVTSYWMVGAFFMAAKRFAEYRSIGDPQRAAEYRRSFRHYNSDNLLVSIFFYATSAALMLGVFIIRYKFELILCVPLFAGFFSVYMQTALKKDSPVQAPERLYRERGLMVYLAVCLLAFVGAMICDVPALASWFNVEQSALPSLWTF